ncbi:nuclear transport factor 2 family protein [Chitinophagaceae bacterium 26-R-25]|nr:nuclear transport factor 2 family protein [Chitinophagaceae bacterium 26-R-25]
MNNKDLALTAIMDVFVKRDITTFDKYFSDNYKQHNPTFPNGTEVLKQIVPNLPADLTYEPGLVAENDDFVMIHGRYQNWNGKNMIGVDIFKIEKGKIVEHWDVLQEEVPPTQSANGNAMFPIK